MRRILDILLGGRAEEDAGFRAGMQQLAVMTLQIVGGLETVVPLLMIVAGIGVVPGPASERNALLPSLAVSVIGLLTLGAANLPALRRYGRVALCLSVWLTAITLEISVRSLRGNVPWIDHYLIGYITLVKLGAASLPFKPWHTLALGLAVDLSHWAFWQWAEVGQAHTMGAGQHFFTVITTLGCTVLTYMIYRQRVLNYYAQQQARRTEARLLITENAAEVGRLAAALSHELNSPIGVLASSVDTLSAVAKRGAPPERLQHVIDEAHRAGKESADRLRQIVGRMQRFTNLDRADVQSVDVNELLKDVVALLEPESRRSAAVELRLQPVPRFVGRPQQLSAVFSNLLGNALSALEGSGEVRVATDRNDSWIEVRFADTGRGMTPEELANAFNPAWFRVSGKRIAASNWSLFTCRQIVQEHGGDIRIASTPGQGTEVQIRLPVDQHTASE